MRLNTALHGCALSIILLNVYTAKGLTYILRDLPPHIDLRGQSLSDVASVFRAMDRDGSGAIDTQVSAWRVYLCVCVREK